MARAKKQGITEKAPGYETVYIARTESTEADLENLKKKLSGIVTQHQGEVAFTEDWGKRKLAYTIKRETKGHYQFFVYTGNNQTVSEIERTLRIQENVIRFITVRLDKPFDPATHHKDNTPLASRRPESDYRDHHRDRDRDRGEYRSGGGDRY